jgi:hypothetical protein
MDNINQRLAISQSPGEQQKKVGRLKPIIFASSGPDHDRTRNLLSSEDKENAVQRPQSESISGCPSRGFSLPE